MNLPSSKFTCRRCLTVASGAVVRRLRACMRGPSFFDVDQCEWARALSIAFSFVLFFLLASTAAAEKRPNILFVLIDDMGWPDLACYGHARHETPNLDRLAAEGVRFTNFYATPVCSSTRATIESGQNSARVGITDFLPGHWRPFEKLVVPPMPDCLDHALVTPGEVLSGAGYLTGYFGKWHLGRGPENAPDRHGYRVTGAQLGKEFQKWRASKIEGPKRMDLLTDQAIYFLKKHVAPRKQPFFLHVSHHAVHIPLQANEETIRKYVEKPKPKTGVNHPVYAAMIEDLDRKIGRLLRVLEELQFSDSTFVVVASDNGGLREVYTGGGQIVSSNVPLRREKGTLYEGGIRVPCIVRWPGVAATGAACEELAATWDLLPTFCAVADVAPPKQPLDGISLTPVLRGTSTRLNRDALYFHYPHYHHASPAGAIRQGDFKLIESFQDGSLELYNLRDDIGESNNLDDSMPDRAKKMRANLAAWRNRVGARMPTPNPQFDPTKRNQWWSRRDKKPLDVNAVGDRMEQRASKPYYRRPLPDE